MVRGLALPKSSRVLDVACGTGLITRLLARRGFEVVSLDLTPAMLSRAGQRGASCINARAEALPFVDDCFDGLSFGYLLRYLDDPAATMQELVRVVRPSGPVGMVEFGLPRRAWKPLWRAYTRFVLPAAGRLAGQGPVLCEPGPGAGPGAATPVRSGSGSSPGDLRTFWRVSAHAALVSKRTSSA